MIPIWLHNHEGTVLIECREPKLLLDHLALPEKKTIVRPDCFIRGVLIPGEGAFFELRDAFGLVMKELAHLDEERAQTLLLDAIW